MGADIEIKNQILLKLDMNKKNEALIRTDLEIKNHIAGTKDAITKILGVLTDNIKFI